MKKKMNLEQVEAAIKQCRSKLKRAINLMEKLEKQRVRLMRPKKEEPLAVEVVAEWLPEPLPEPELLDRLEKLAPADDLAIPDFLQRKPDPVAEQIKTEQAETKKAKARGRIEKMKAKQRGDLKKMPLTGKAALAAIRGA